MNKDLKLWAVENDEALVALYFNCDSDLYEDYYPYDPATCHTDEQYLEFEENFDGDLPEGFVTDVYMTLGTRCPQTLLLL